MHLYNIVEITSTDNEDKVSQGRCYLSNKIQMDIKFYSDQEKQSEEAGIVVKTASKAVSIFCWGYGGYACAHVG